MDIKRTLGYHGARRRFILSMPAEETHVPERVCFQAEMAHWFYEDFYRQRDASLPFFNLKTFCLALFAHCPTLHRYMASGEQMISDFIKYKIQVPACGAILLNKKMNKVSRVGIRGGGQSVLRTCCQCLMVKGWNSKSAWGFPRGKIDEDEEKSACAIREVQRGRTHVRTVC